MVLRALKSKDVDGMLEWMQDEQIQQNFREEIEKRTLEDALHFIETSDTKFVEDRSVHFAIVDDQDEYMGTISLKNINMRDRNAEYAISMRKKAHGKGYAKAATKELFELAFKKNGIHKIYLNVLSQNERAIRFYEKMGFHYEGESVDHLFLRGSYESLKWYAILENEYKE